LPGEGLVGICSSLNSSFTGKRWRREISHKTISLGRVTILKLDGDCEGKENRKWADSILSDKWKSRES
jgi:hypothetical protein